MATFSLKPTLGLLGLSVVLGTSLCSIGFWIVAPCSPPDPVDFVAAGRIIREGFLPQDAVAVRPWWAARIREQVGDLNFLAVRDFDQEDLSRLGRLWLVSLAGYDDLPPGPFTDGTYSVERDMFFGGLRVRLFRLSQPSAPIFRLREAIATARVRMQTNGVWNPCPLQDNRFQCSPREWNYVGPVSVEVGTEPRDAIWAHPSDTGPIEVAFDQVPHGQELVVYTGLTSTAARVPDMAPVLFQVILDDQPQAEITHPNEHGYRTHRFPLAALGPGPHRVVLRIQTPFVGMRHFVFDGEVRQ